MTEINILHFQNLQFNICKINTKSAILSFAKLHTTRNLNFSCNLDKKPFQKSWSSSDRVLLKVICLVTARGYLFHFYPCKNISYQISEIFLVFLTFDFSILFRLSENWDRIFLNIMNNFLVFLQLKESLTFWTKYGCILLDDQ